MQRRSVVSRKDLGIALPTAVSIAVLGAITLYFVQIVPEHYIYLYNRFLLLAVAGMALNLLMGTAGQVSLGTAAFLAIGAFSSVACFRVGVPFPLDIVFGTLAGSVVGLLVGLPSLRIRGIYLALSTLAVHFLVVYVANNYQSSTVGPAGFIIPGLFSSYGGLLQQEYWAIVLYVVVALGIVIFSRLSILRTGRAWRMIRDHEPAAPALGINVTGYKLFAFTLSSAVTSLVGGLTLHFTGSVSVESFGLDVAIAAIAMLVIGGLDSVLGAVIGAAVITALPQLIPELVNPLLPVSRRALAGPQVAQVVYGLMIVLLVTRSSGGLVAWGRDLRNLGMRVIQERS
jgi:branched-chain amino acid transport system permease protein